MPSRTARAVNLAVDELAEVVADQVGCTAYERDRSSNEVSLHFDRQTTGAGGYDDRESPTRRANVPIGPQTNVAKVWQNRCAMIPSEAAALKQYLAAEIEQGAINFESAAGARAKDPADVELKDWGLPGFPTTPLEQALFVGSLFGGRFGKWIRRGGDVPPEGPNKPVQPPKPEKGPTGAKQLDLPPGFPTTPAEVNGFLHSLHEAGFKEMFRSPQRVRLWDKEAQITVVEYRGISDRFVYLAFFENKLVSFAMHEGQSLSLANRVAKLSEMLPFTLTHFFPHIFRIPK